jgi:hypothetical protein
MENGSAGIPFSPTVFHEFHDSRVGGRAISLYIDTLKEDGQPVPEPLSKAGHVCIAA